MCLTKTQTTSNIIYVNETTINLAISLCIRSTIDKFANNIDAVCCVCVWNFIFRFRYMPYSAWIIDSRE